MKWNYITVNQIRNQEIHLMKGKILNTILELKHTCGDVMELNYSKANNEPGNTFDER